MHDRLMKVWLLGLVAGIGLASSSCTDNQPSGGDGGTSDSNGANVPTSDGAGSLLDGDSSLAADKRLLKGRYLQLEGGFRIPLLDELGAPNMKYSALAIDLRPGSNAWVTTHPAGYVVELTEPGEMGTGDSTAWPTLVLGRRQQMFEAVDKIGPGGAFWIDADTVLTSGRKSYRSGFTNDWIGTVDLSDGAQAYYTIKAPTDTEGDNFHVLQALGGGFMRIADDTWALAVAHGNRFLLGRGGYDVLGSPLGPALAAWSIGDPHAAFVLDFPQEHQERRDPFYLYPSLDPKTYDKAQLPIWHDANETDGYWQAGDVGGLAFIHHPTIKGVVATHNHGRGVHDYRAQGDCGSGKFFLVHNPSVFYSADSCGGNRGEHEEEVENATYPDGVYARVAHVYDPDEIENVAAGGRAPWEVSSSRFDWPKVGLNFSEDAKKPTEIRGIHWDDDRQLLWVAMNWPTPILVAYSIVVDDARPEPELQLTTALEDLFQP